MSACNILVGQDYRLKLTNSVCNEKDSLLQLSFVIENYSGRKSLMSLSDNFCSTKQKECYCSYGVVSSDTLYLVMIIFVI